MQDADPQAAAQAGGAADIAPLPAAIVPAGKGHQNRARCWSRQAHTRRSWEASAGPYIQRSSPHPEGVIPIQMACAAVMQCCCCLVATVALRRLARCQGQTTATRPTGCGRLTHRIGARCRPCTPSATGRALQRQPITRLRPNYFACHSLPALALFAHNLYISALSKYSDFMRKCSWSIPRHCPRQTGGSRQRQRLRTATAC